MEGTGSEKDWSGILFEERKKRYNGKPGFLSTKKISPKKMKKTHSTTHKLD
jgi:hypothetical protein